MLYRVQIFTNGKWNHCSTMFNLEETLFLASILRENGNMVRVLAKVCHADWAH